MATSVDRPSNAGDVSASADEGAKFLSLVNDTADGLGRLVAAHVRMLHLELVADAKTFAREATFVALSGFFLAFGYAVLWLGIAVLLETTLSLRWALLLSGAIHLVGGGVALMWAIARLRIPNTVAQTGDEMMRSLDALSAPLSPPSRTTLTHGRCGPELGYRTASCITSTEERASL